MTGATTPELPPAKDGKCPTCDDWLYYCAEEGGRPACFFCKKCGQKYRGAKEWKLTSRGR